LIKYPPNTLIVENKDISLLERNKYGAIKVDDELEQYLLTFGNALTPDSLNLSSIDLHIPEIEKTAIDSFISLESIDSLSPPKEIIAKLESIFIKKYRYALSYKIKGVNDPQTDLGFFLLNSREGHCEYFATASALILRRLHIPVRYSTGYSLQEFSNLEKKYVARKRHAHAWNEVMINNRWQNFDPTPPDWGEVDKESVSPFAIIRDLFSWAGFKLDQLRKSDKNLFLYIMGVFSILVVFYIWRIFFKHKKGKRRVNKSAEKMDQKVLKSDIYKLLNSKFIQLGYYRYDWETIGEWFERIKLNNKLNSRPHSEKLDQLLKLYYTIRFDSQESSKDKFAEFKKMLDEIASDFTFSNPSNQKTDINS
jgi:hypothetical protein